MSGKGCWSLSWGRGGGTCLGGAEIDKVNTQLARTTALSLSLRQRVHKRPGYIASISRKDNCRITDAYSQYWRNVLIINSVKSANYTLPQDVRVLVSFGRVFPLVL